MRLERHHPIDRGKRHGQSVGGSTRLGSDTRVDPDEAPNPPDPRESTNGSKTSRGRSRRQNTGPRVRKRKGGSSRAAWLAGSDRARHARDLPIRREGRTHGDGDKKDGQQRQRPHCGLQRPADHRAPASTRDVVQRENPHRTKSDSQPEEKSDQIGTNGLNRVKKGAAIATAHPTRPTIKACFEKRICGSSDPIRKSGTAFPLVIANLLRAVPARWDS